MFMEEKSSEIIKTLAKAKINWRTKQLENNELKNELNKNKKLEQQKLMEIIWDMNQRITFMIFNDFKQ